MTLIYLGSAWITGIFIGSMLDIPLVIATAALLPLPLVLIRRKQRNAIILLSLCLLAFFAGAARFQSSLPVVDGKAVQYYNDRGEIEIEGIVSAEAESGAKSSRLRLSVTSIVLDDTRSEASGSVLITVPAYPAYRYGDFLRVHRRTTDACPIC